MSPLVFDFDSTLVAVEALDELFERSVERALDRDRRVAEFRGITDLGMEGELAADEALARRLALLDADRALVEEVAREIPDRLSPSVERQLSFFRDNADRIHVVSGGFEELIRPTLDRIGIPASRLSAHRFLFDPAGRITGLDPDTVMARGGKAAALHGLREPDSQLWMVGDGATDLEVRDLGLADRFVAFTENRHRDAVVARADHVARSMEELFELLENW
jgi:D-3-phosphoglycerate dehydrogenase / 2-oxoglutarate reductase